MNYCYLHFKVFPEFIRAALLVTDERTKTLEFRITSKIILDDLQKIIYGESLKDFLFVEKIGKELIDSAQVDFGTCFVKEKDLLNLRDKIDKPVFLLQKYDEFKARDKFSIKLQSANTKFEPIMIRFLAKDEDDMGKFIKIFQESFKYSNIMEPFERIERAIEFLNLQEENV
ncbi:MAG: hypothetical protein N2Z81_05730 [Hydrogenothermaceae bacterium]|nr:hypothetical protein [Hydrogenothermaceae bacterium]